jgi:phosphoserine phosphatase
MNLVIQGASQGPRLAQDEISQLVALTGANHVVTLGACAWRLTGVALRHEVEPWCAQRALDFAWVPDERRLADLRLLALDMDSTLITIESIDEMGGVLGIRERVAAVTAAAMRGEIDYPESLRRRVALLAGLEEQALERILEERVHLSPGAEALVARCRKAGIRTLLVSGGFSFFTRHLKDELELDFTLSNELEIAGGRLTGRLLGEIVDGEAKAAKLVAVRNELGLAREQTLAVGDGANDIPMMREAGLSVAYRAKPLVREHATHALDHAQLDGVLNLFL